MRTILCALAVSFCFACGSNLPATPDPAMPSMPSTPATAGGGELKPAGVAKVGDKTKCPVTGEEFTVTAESPKVDHDGKTYYFCCKGCDKKFQGDPAKYLSKS